jgi:ABC-type Zn2+ transport system substrate-binding protein/surface adhesin
MANINWTEDSLEELLEKSIGDIRETLAHEDADIDFKTFLVENGWIESEDEDDEDYEDEEDDNYDEDEDDDWDDDEEEDEEDTPSDLSYEEEEIARNIASDIDNGNYTLDTVRAFYDYKIIDRVEELLD